MTDKELFDKMYEYFSDNPEEFAQVLSEMDSWNGYLNGEQWYDMDMFDDLHYGLKPSKIAEMIFYGGNFCPNDSYFRYDSLERLESSDTLDYDDYLYRSNMEDILEYYENGHCDVPSEVEDMIDEYHESEEEEDDIEDEEVDPEND